MGSNWASKRPCQRRWMGSNGDTWGCPLSIVFHTLKSFWLVKSLLGGRIICRSKRIQSECQPELHSKLWGQPELFDSVSKHQTQKTGILTLNVPLNHYNKLVLSLLLKFLWDFMSWFEEGACHAAHVEVRRQSTGSLLPLGGPQG